MPGGLAGDSLDAGGAHVGQHYCCTTTTLHYYYTVTTILPLNYYYVGVSHFG